MKNKLNRVKYFPEDKKDQKTLNELKYFQEDESDHGWDDATKPNVPATSPLPSQRVASQQPPEFNGITTVKGRKLEVKYDQTKDLLMLRTEDQPNGIGLHGGNIDKLLKMLAKVR